MESICFINDFHVLVLQIEVSVISIRAESENGVQSSNYDRLCFVIFTHLFLALTI